jgi:hypothetical protein
VSSMMGEAATGGSVGLSGSSIRVPSSLPRMGTTTALVGVDATAAEEPEVILGHPALRAPGDVSLSEAMGTTHWSINQAHSVLHQERENIDNERRPLLLWGSLFKERTTSEKEKAEAKHVWLGVKEDLINKKQATVEELDA